jgi:hypothetical protein
MKRCLFSMLSTIGAFVMLTGAVAGGIAIQKPGTDYLVVEAEAFEKDELNNPSTGWVIIRPDQPQEVQLHSTNPGTIMVPPPSSNPSQGAAIFDLEGGGDFADQVGYALQFTNPGTYYLYLRYSMFDLRSLVDNAYGNEDSVYLPVESLGQDPTLQELRDSRDGNVGLSTNGRVPSDGCRSLEEPWVIPDAQCDAQGLRGESQMEGQYHWQPANWGNGLGHANYEVTDVGTVLDFAVATRERGSSLDALIFSQNTTLTAEDLDKLLFPVVGVTGDFNANGVLDGPDIDDLTARSASGVHPAGYDLNADSLVNQIDINVWVKDLRKSWIGDANVDGEFNSGDLVTLFTAGTYEQEVSAVWSQGDFDGNGRFTSGDLVAALTDGGYEKGPRAGVAAVPEPTGCVMMVVGAALLVRKRK